MLASTGDLRTHPRKIRGPLPCGVNAIEAAKEFSTHDSGHNRLYCINGHAKQNQALWTMDNSTLGLSKRKQTKENT